MIQRIQTIYLFLSVLAGVAFVFIPFGHVTNNEGHSEVLIIKEVIPIMITVLIASIISFISIFLFKNRKLQSKIVLLSIIVSLVLIGLFIFGITQHVGLENYTFGIGAILPVFILVFNLLALGAIKSDEALVKSMDRLR